MLLVDIAVAYAIVFIMVYMVTDSAQKFFYDQVVPGLWWRAMVCAIPMSLLMVLFPFRLDDSVISGLHWIVLQIIVWSVLFHYVCQYHWGHACVVGSVSYLLFGWIVTMALDSMNRVGVVA